MTLLRQQLAETQQMLQEAQARLLSHESSQENLSSADTSWQHNPKYRDYEHDYTTNSKPTQNQDNEMKDILHR